LQGAFEILHQRIQPPGGGGPLGLLRRQLVRRPADLLDRGPYLIGG
jgi:hypothetical protein